MLLAFLAQSLSRTSASSWKVRPEFRTRKRERERAEAKGDGDDGGGNEEPREFFSFSLNLFSPSPAGRTADDAIRELNAAHAAYRRVEASLQAKRARLLSKLPEISRARAAVVALRESLGGEEGDEEGAAAEREKSADAAASSSKHIDLDFCVAEQVYSRARVDRRRLRDGGVALWLGAGVSVEYPLAEAQALLEANEAAAKRNIKANGEDLDFVRDCITTTQVSISRVYNWDVARGKSGGAGAGAGGAKPVAV